MQLFELRVGYFQIPGNLKLGQILWVFPGVYHDADELIFRWLKDVHNFPEKVDLLGVVEDRDVNSDEVVVVLRRQDFRVCL